SQRKADLISAKWEAWRQRVAKGERIPPPGLMPYWIVWDEVANALAVRPDARAAIKLVFKLAAEGLGFERTVNRLNTLGIAPFGKRADRWTRSYVCKLLRCRSLLGEVVLKDGREIADFYPPVVSLEEWHVARMALIARINPRSGAGRPSPSVRNLFTGLVFDATDGEAFRVQEQINAKGGNRRLSFISAGSIARRKTDCPSSPIPYHVFENAFLRFVSELKVADLDAAARTKDEEQLTILEGEQADL